MFRVAKPNVRLRFWRSPAVAGAICVTVLMVAYSGGAQASPAAAQAQVTAMPAMATRSVPPACPADGRTPLYRDTRYSFADRAADLVSCMTLTEKVGQLRTDNAPAIPRLGVQQYTYWSEGLHGISKLRADTKHSGRSGRDQLPRQLRGHDEREPRSSTRRRRRSPTRPADCSISRCGAPARTTWAHPRTTMECSPLGSDSEHGSRPRWGRTDEAFGEDPYLASQTADAFVEDTRARR